MSQVLKDRDRRFMRAALRQARNGLGRTSPNPPVGAVIVRDDRIIASGYHRKSGMPHAEIEALNKVSENARGATLYVTLEPCNHYGKTPPCTKAIVRAGIVRVVVGARDMNPNVDGGGCDYLSGRGVEVVTGVLEPECKELIEAFIGHSTEGRPFITVKSALTLDGWAGSSTGHSKWITNEKSRSFVHLLRDRSDAVMVGVGTVIADDPMLTCRRKAGKDPIRIVLDTRLRTPLNSRLLNQNSKAENIIAVGSGIAGDRVKVYEDKGARIIRCPEREAGLDIPWLMETLAKMDIMSILVEGGSKVIGSIMRECLADKFYVFRSPKLLGGNDGIPMAHGHGALRMDRCVQLRDISIRHFGEDLLTVGYPVYPPVDRIN